MVTGRDTRRRTDSQYNQTDRGREKEGERKFCRRGGWHVQTPQRCAEIMGTGTCPRERWTWCPRCTPPTKAACNVAFDTSDCLGKHYYEGGSGRLSIDTQVSHITITNNLVTHDKYSHTPRANTSYPLPAPAHQTTDHRLSPSAETTYNRSKTEDIVPHSSIRTHPDYLPQNASSAATVRVGTTSRYGVGVARRSNPCCTFGARRM